MKTQIGKCEEIKIMISMDLEGPAEELTQKSKIFEDFVDKTVEHLRLEVRKQTNKLLKKFLECILLQQSWSC